MILIVGGAFQGKTEFARKQFGLDPELIADGAVWRETEAEKEASPGTEPDSGRCAGIRSYQLRIREQLKKGLDPGEELRRLIAEDPGILIIADEIGNGLIPMEREERDYREAVGRTLCLAAQEADEVWRVICGIGQRIK